ncbi:MAG: cadherin-like domain-containing protein, partial [Magnetospirillum sp. WYHS-4]
NDGPTTSAVTLDAGTEDTSVVISKADLLANAADVDGDALSAANITSDHGTVVDNGDGTVTFTPDANYNGAVTFGYTVSDGHGGTASGSATMNVAAVNDGPTTSTVTLGAGTEDTSVVISKADLLANASDLDGDSLSAANITSNHGTIVDNGNGTVTFTPDANYSGAVTFSYTVSDGHGGTASGSATMNLAGVADSPTLDGVNVSGNEDSAIALNISAALTDASETMSIIIAGVPEGASLSAGMDNGDGTWTLTGGELNGLTITPPTNYNGNFNLSVTATSVDGTSQATATDSFQVHVNPMAEQATVDGANVSGTEDNSIALNITGSANTFTISGLPEGASLSAGTENADGTWTVSSGQLSGLTVTPPQDYSGSFNLTVTAQSVDGSDVSTATDTFTVNVSGVADEAGLNVTLGAGQQSVVDDTTGRTITGTSGNDSLAGGAGNDVISTGGSSGEDFIDAGKGDDTITGSGSTDDRLLGGLGDDKIYSSDSSGDMMVGGGGDDQAWGGGGNDLYVFEVGGGDDTFHGGSGTDQMVLMGDNGVITDASQFTITMTSGSYTAQSGYLQFSSGATGVINFADGSSLTFDGVEKLQLQDDFSFDDGWDFFQGADQRSDSFQGIVGDGNYFGSAGNDTITGNTAEDFVSGGAGNDVISTGDDNDILIGGTGNDRLTAGSDNDIMAGNEGNDVLDGGSGSADIAVFSGNRAQYMVTQNADGSYSVRDLVVGRDGTDTVSNVEKFQFADGTVTSSNLVGTNPSDTSGGSAGTETVYDLDISASLGDSSETLGMIVISGVPDGVSFSAGTDNGNGTWSIEREDLTDLTMTVQSGVTTDFQLSIAVTSTDGTSTATTVQTLSVDVSADAGGGDEGGDAGGGDAAAVGMDNEGHDYAAPEAPDAPDVPGSFGSTLSSGHNTYWGGSGTDVVDGGSGKDTMGGGSGDDTLYGNADKDTLYGDGGNDVLLGGADKDTAWGGSGNDVIDGGTGDDSIGGDDGNDTLFGGDGKDTVWGGSGDDVLSGGEGNDTLGADSGNDTVFDGAGNDTVYGGSGNDTMVAGSGDDDVYGESGNDLFVFGGGAGSDYFDGGSGWSDTIQLTGISNKPNAGDWTLELDSDVGYTETEAGLEFEGDVSGTIRLEDGSELTFSGVEKIEW